MGGFMSAQSFYMFIQEFINAWDPPARMAAAQMRALASEVVRELLQAIAVSYPILRESMGAVASSILETSEHEALRLLEGLVLREKDPFTINEFLQAHINKLRYDRFESSVDAAFKGSILGDCSGQSGSWQATKSHIGASLRSWYLSAHGVSSSANAEDMSAILESYWCISSILVPFGPRSQFFCKCRGHVSHFRGILVHLFDLGTFRPTESVLLQMPRTCQPF